MLHCLYSYIYIAIYIYNFSRSHVLTLRPYCSHFLFHYFFLLPLCSRSHACTPSHSLFAFKSNKRIPLCSHFFFHFTYFFSQSQPFFQQYFFYYHLIMLSFFFHFTFFFLNLNNIIQQYIFIMLSLCSHASIFFIFCFFISVSGGTLTDISFMQLFQLQHQLFQILIFLHHYSLYK